MAASCAVYMVASLASCIIMDPDVPGIHLNFRDDLIIPNLQVATSPGAAPLPSSSPPSPHITAALSPYHCLPVVVTGRSS